MRAGFTLIEVLAAVFLTAIVMTVAITFFVTLSDSTNAAAKKARQGRRAIAVLDRVGNDLEGAYLLSKPPQLDPLQHPWIFVAESHEGDSTSDRLLFVSRSRRPRNDLGHGSDLAVITYLLHPSVDAPGFDLLRAVSPRLSPDQDREFPSSSDERFMVVAEGVDHFGLRFMSDEFEWLDDWDSTQLEQSAALPRAAEIEIAYLPELPPGTDAFDDIALVAAGEGESRVYTRRLRLPMQAVDLNSMLAAVVQEAAAEDAEDEPEDEFEDEFDDEAGDEGGDDDPGEGVQGAEGGGGTLTGAGGGGTP